ncbi:hypothetical protein DFH11DRAFT_1289145 [Phellopilus nigrolimitatus]|nr:hypothetical protein DFH11DRAFT_1289145 [Phellopilus nigrolimitatus]
MLKVCNFSYDMQANDDIRVLVVSECADNNVRERTLEIFQISFQIKPAKQVYMCKPKELDDQHGPVQFAKLSGDISAAYTSQHLVLTFWKEDRLVVIVQSDFDTVDMIDDYLVCVCTGSGGSKSIVAVLLSSIHDILPSTATPRETLVLTLDGIPYSSFPVLSFPRWRNSGTMVSICNFHWKTEAERKRKGITITASRDVWSEDTSRQISLVDTFLLETTTDGGDTSESRALLPDGDLPRLKHLGSIVLDPQRATYSPASPTSQFGSTVVMSYDGALNRLVFRLATITCEKGVVFRSLDVPHATNLVVEFYSGHSTFRRRVGHPSSSSITTKTLYFD